MRFMMLMIPKGYEQAAPGTMPDAKGVEAMMKGLSGIPETEWTPIRSHLDALEDFGLIRPEVSEIGHGRYWMTDRGRKLVDG